MKNILLSFLIFVAAVARGDLVRDLTIQNTISAAGTLTPAQITANQNDYTPTGIATATTLRLSTDAARNVTGLAAGSSGRLLLLENIGSFNVTLVNASSSSTAANRFAFATDATLAPGESLWLIYDATTARWRSVSGGITAAYQPLDSDLSALAANSTNGLWARTGAGTGAARTLTSADSTHIVITNPDGVSGNPTFDIGSAVVTLTGTQSLTNKTETSPKLVTSILDANGAIYATLTPAASAVNYVNFTNAATGNSPTWTATGSDSDINLVFTSKNNGRVIFSKAQVGTTTGTALGDYLNLYGASTSETRIGSRYAASSGSSTGTGLDFTLSRGSLATPSAVQSTDVPFSILVGGYGNSTWNNNQASFFAQATENWSSGHLGLKWVFGGTPAGSGTQGTFFTIDSVLSAGTGPTTLTDTTGKILSAALNTVAVGQGGTGLTSGTSGGIPYFSSTSTIAASSDQAAGGDRERTARAGSHGTVHYWTGQIAVETDRFPGFG